MELPSNTQRCSSVDKQSTAIPKPSEIYERLVEALDPPLTTLAMRRVTRLNHPSWTVPSSSIGERLFISAQIDTKATDQFAGGGFRLELEKSPSLRPDSGLNGRVLFFQLLTSAELAQFLQTQNRIIRSLPQPPPEAIDRYPEGPIRQQYLRYFEPQDAFDAVKSWMRFRSRADVDEWVRLLEPISETLLKRTDELLQSTELYLGRGQLIRS